LPANSSGTRDCIRYEDHRNTRSDWFVIHGEIISV
jgi:hypothetical protein